MKDDQNIVVSIPVTRYKELLKEETQLRNVLFTLITIAESNDVVAQGYVNKIRSAIHDTKVWSL